MADDTQPQNKLALHSEDAVIEFLQKNPALSHPEHFSLMSPSPQSSLTSTSIRTSLSPPFPRNLFAVDSSTKVLFVVTTVPVPRLHAISLLFPDRSASICTHT